MGYRRRYHAYMFVDPTDGAQFGISGPGHPGADAGPAGPVDMMHMRHRGYEMIDDRQVRLSQLVQAPGDQLIYYSDLGDLLNHTITVTEIVDYPLKLGYVELIDVLGPQSYLIPDLWAWPEEDNDGSRGFCELRDGDYAAAQRFSNWGTTRLDDFWEYLNEPHRRSSPEAKGARALRHHNGLVYRGSEDASRLIEKRLVDAAKRPPSLLDDGHIGGDMSRDIDELFKQFAEGRGFPSDGEEQEPKRSKSKAKRRKKPRQKPDRPEKGNEQVGVEEEEIDFAEDDMSADEIDALFENPEMMQEMLMQVLMGNPDGNGPELTASQKDALKDAVRIEPSHSRRDGEREIDAMSVKQLKSHIAAAGLSSADCVEKSDLQERAREASAVMRSQERAGDDDDEQCTDDKVRRELLGDLRSEPQYVLIGASALGFADIVQRALDTGEVSVNEGSEDDPGRNGLYQAAANGHLDVLKLLARNGGKLAKRQASGHTPMYVAAFQGHADIVSWLMEQGLDPASTSADDGITPLMAASVNGHTDVVHAMIRYWGAQAAENIDVIDLVGDDKRDDGTTFSGEGGALQLAAREGHVDVMELLLEAGGSVDLRDDTASTPLMTAAVHDRVAAVQLLLKAGADVNARAEAGKTPLLEVAWSLEFRRGPEHAKQKAAEAADHEEVARLLLEAGANVDDSDPNGMTSLMLAAYQGDTAVAHQLLLAGASTELRSAPQTDFVNGPPGEATAEEIAYMFADQLPDAMAVGLLIKSHKRKEREHKGSPPPKETYAQFIRRDLDEAIESAPQAMEDFEAMYDSDGPRSLGWSSPYEPGAYVYGKDVCKTHAGRKQFRMQGGVEDPELLDICFEFAAAHMEDSAAEARICGGDCPDVLTFTDNFYTELLRLFFRWVTLYACQIV